MNPRLTDETIRSHTRIFIVLLQKYTPEYVHILGSHEPASLLHFTVPFRKYSAREFGCYPAQLVLVHLIAETDTKYITDNVFMPVKSVRLKPENLSAILEKRR